ncbi:hypothetical protein SAMN02745146_2114 [Hymenobacter daecheongensis DSM 21074]|uniref:DUF6565 domain-containing protein n=1 Tax=Hymenobacter daecheongensis DSM 21074 TaxID=1121955 RepID=A0A1M6G4R3_9BACT|nr:DUF6565 domain-containing protein [Hymenobacter daecheongensis]SHJ04882.1 hypothetical protein SAMN02745146_2114 [Hymenobacter daecheongensis DSM 21074]
MKNLLLPLSFVAFSLLNTPLAATAQMAPAPKAPVKTPTPAAKAPAAKTPPARSQEPILTTPKSLERDLDVFSSWVNERISQAESTVRRELPRIKEDFDRQSKRIDAAVDSLSGQSKREYTTQKVRYEKWASKQDSLDAVARRPETAAETQRRLLNETVVISTARATELPDLYGRLLEHTRDNRRQWSQADWSAASAVLERLNARYEVVREQLSLDDRIRVRSLQTEFRTLEKARDVKDLVNDK